MAFVDYTNTFDYLCLLDLFVEYFTKDKILTGDFSDRETPYPNFFQFSSGRDIQEIKYEKVLEYMIVS